MELTRLVVDASSVVKAFMFLKDAEFGTDVQFEGKTFHIPDVETSLERLEMSIEKTLNLFDLEWRDIIWVSDPPKSGQARRLLFPDYRTGRPERPKEWKDASVALLDQARQLVMTKGGVSATPKVKPAVEADDLCNEICKRFPKTILWARDKDLLACPATIHYQDGEVDPEKFPAERRHIQLYRTIVSGDSSDGIGSCKGFGDAAWAGMIKEFGYEAIDTLLELIENRQLHKLEEDIEHFSKLKLIVEQREELYRNYEVMKFLPVPAHKIDWKGAYPESTDILVVKHNFEECFNEVARLLPQVEYTTIDYETDVCAESRAWADRAEVKVDVMGSEITGMGLRIQDRNYYFCVDHAETDNIELADLEKVARLLKEKKVIAHNSTGFENVVTYNHFGFFHKKTWDTTLMASYVQEEGFNNLKSLSKQFLDYKQATYEETVGDRSGMRELTGDEVFKYGIDDVAVTDALHNLFLNIMQYEDTLKVFEQVELKSAFFTSMAFIRGVEFDQEAFEQLVKDNDEKRKGLAVKVNEGLAKLGWQDPNGRKPIKVKTGAAIKRVFEAKFGEELDVPDKSAKGVASHIEDEEILQAVEEGAGALDILYQKYWTGPEVAINTRSPKQMHTLLYETIKLPIRGRNLPTEKMRAERKEGSPKTDEHAIENAIAFGDIDGEVKATLEALLQYKECLTRQSLFFDKYPKLLHWKTGKLHCSMRQSATTTRRFTHSSPNLAQISKKKGKEVRNMLKAPEGYLFADFDVDSQELKLQAWKSQCPQFLACYTGTKEQRKDVHSATGFYIAHLKQESYSNYDEFKEAKEAGDELAGSYRAKGKTTNFASAYLSTDKTLAWQLRVEEKDAKEFMVAKGNAFPGLMPAVAAYIEKCRKRGYSKTLLGARRHLHKALAMDRPRAEKWVPKKKDHKWTKSDRLCWSFAIQGSGAEEIKLNMGRIVEDSNYFEDDTIYPQIQIHDEVVLIIKEELIPEYVPAIQAIFEESYADMKLQPGTTPEVGKNFGSLKKWQGQID